MNKNIGLYAYLIGETCVKSGEAQAHLALPIATPLIHLLYV